MTDDQVNQQPTGVAVLGVHRSGTSVFAGILAEAGYFAGKDIDILPAARDNARGFFERFDVIELNNEILKQMGGTWDNPPLRESVFSRMPAWSTEIEKILDDMVVEAGGRPLVLKDPRMNLLLPIWMDVLGDRIVFVLVSRNPLEVAMSIHERDGRPVDAALALWQLYWSDLLYSLAGQRVWFARYESLLRNPEQQSSILLNALSVQFALAPEETTTGDVVDVSGTAEFVTGELRHHRVTSSGNDVEHLLTGDQLDLWRWICTLEEGWITLEPPVRFLAQSKEALACLAEDSTTMRKPAPAPTLRGALRLARHHFREGGISRAVGRLSREALRIARRH